MSFQVKLIYILTETLLLIITLAHIFARFFDENIFEDPIYSWLLGSEFSSLWFSFADDDCGPKKGTQSWRPVEWAKDEKNQEKTQKAKFCRTKITLWFSSQAQRKEDWRRWQHKALSSTSRWLSQWLCGKQSRKHVTPLGQEICRRSQIQWRIDALQMTQSIKQLGEQSGVQLNSFRCAMHPLDTFCQGSKKALKKYEPLPDRSRKMPFNSGGESNVQALIRVGSKKKSHWKLWWQHRS